jgi:hypothetical protein
LPSVLREQIEQLKVRESPLREEGKLKYKFPDMPKHPDQEYKSVYT